MAIAEAGRDIYAGNEGIHLEWGIHYGGEKKAIAVQMNMNNVGVRKIGFLL